MKNKGMKDKIKISSEKRKEMIEAIKAFYFKEREEEIGDLAASIILDFFIEELSPVFYNQGIYDSYKYMSDRVEEVLGLEK